MTQKSSVLHVIDHLQIGGAQRLLEVLRNGTPLEESIHILSMGRNDDGLKTRLSQKNVNITVEPDCRLWRPTSFWRILRAIRRIDPDVLHLHLTYSTIIGAFAGWMAARPVVVSIHNTHTVQDSGLRGAVLRFLETAAVRLFVDRVIFVGRVTAEANSHRFGSVPMTTIDNVVEPSDPSLRDRRQEMRETLGCFGSDVVILSTARLHPTKNLGNLLEAFASVSRANPESRLWICGEGPMRGALQDQAQALGLGSSVVFLGGRNDVPLLLHAADIFALSSDAEGLPLALLEAMAAGLPVVATAVGSVPAYVQPDVGNLVPPRRPDEMARALQELVRDPERRTRVAAAASEHSRQFTDIARWREALETEYAEALKKRSRVTQA